MLLVPALFVFGMIVFVLKLHWGNSVEATCTVKTCPLELRESDTGKSFVYEIPTRFQIVLREDGNPKERFTVQCSPTDAIGAVPDIPVSPATSSYYLRFEGAGPGKCFLSDDNFEVNIFIMEPGS